jgi:hypothetical protein
VPLRIHGELQLIVTIREISEYADSVWAALRYGWVMGAPVTPVMEEVFEAQRAATRATLCCFHVASRLELGDGTSEQQDAWGAMGRVPMDLIEKILLGAHFEIWETLHRTFLGKCDVSVRITEPPHLYRVIGTVQPQATPSFPIDQYIWKTGDKMEQDELRRCLHKLMMHLRFWGKLD